MASRTKQKEEARARRLAEERARAERSRRQRRLQMVGGVVIGAIAVVVIAIVISSSGGGSSSVPPPSSAKAKAIAASVQSLISGIPQSGNRLGSPNAKVTLTEYGDLECPICKDFATGAEKQLIANDVRQGKVQLVYRSLETATSNAPDPSIFVPQQGAALAAGLQNHEWDYILLFYDEQGPEATGYVNNNYLNGLASQIPGLNYQKWLSDRNSSSLGSQVNSDEQSAASRGFNSTPTILVQGPKGEGQPLVGNQDYGTVESAIRQVS
jgi:protein-disulfide isomerase